LRRDRETFLVLCKHWKEHRVAVEVVQQLHRIMTARGAAGGMVVTSGRFSREAASFASGVNIRLIDGAILAGMLQARQPPRVRAGVGAT
jgi:restriction system protein